MLTKDRKPELPQRDKKPRPFRCPHRLHKTWHHHRHRILPHIRHCHPHRAWRLQCWAPGPWHPPGWSVHSSQGRSAVNQRTWPWNWLWGAMVQGQHSRLQNPTYWLILPPWRVWQHQSGRTCILPCQNPYKPPSHTRRWFQPARLGLVHRNTNTETRMQTPRPAHKADWHHCQPRPHTTYHRTNQTGPTPWCVKHSWPDHDQPP